MSAMHFGFQPTQKLTDVGVTVFGTLMALAQGAEVTDEMVVALNNLRPGLGDQLRDPVKLDELRKSFAHQSMSDDEDKR